MKRISLILVLLLLLSILMAHADSPIDTVFDANQAVLIETENAGFDFKACTVVIPDPCWDLWKIEKPSVDGLDSMIAEALANAEVFSISPAGTSALIVVGGVRGKVFALNGGSITALYPSETRGVADEYFNMRRQFSASPRFYLGDEGVTWSPDGRYAVITNVNTVLYGYFFLDPMIIDTLSGEVFLTATYDNLTYPKERHENGGALTAACFSRDGAYLYYTFVGNLGQGAHSLLRCELATGETELLYSGDDQIYYPRLAELRDGSFLILRDLKEADQAMGVAQIAPVGSLLGQEGSNWSIGVTSFDLPRVQWRVKQMDYSAESGWALCLGRAATSGYGYALQRFRPDEGYVGLNQCWLLRADTLEFICAEGDMSDVLNQMFSDNYSLSDSPYLALLCSQLSPDGQYALVQFRDQAEDGSIIYPLLLVRLEDMKALRVSGISEDTLLPYRTDLARIYAPGMEWNCDQLLLLAGTEVRTYRFDAER